MPGDEFIFLYGPPGVGKSVVGRQLAEDMALPFYDLDAEVAARSGAAIPEIFALEGEAGFRQREGRALVALLEATGGVIALGGGTLLNGDLRKRVEAAGAVLCLHAPPETLLERLAATGDERPLLSGDVKARLQDLVAARADHYRSFPSQLDAAIDSPREVSWQARVCLGRFHVRGMGPRGYDVIILREGLDQLGSALTRLGLRGPVALVSDENVAPRYAARLEASLGQADLACQLLTIPAGEAHKTMATVEELWEGFIRAGLARQSTVVALGGGVVGDLAGFAAGTYLRGVAWVAVPTSLLAMVDASLGGKTGTNLPQGKNLVGVFHPPRLVLADPEALASLPETELRAGLAEVLKAGVIGDPALFALCSQGWEAVLASLEEIVRRAAAVKVKVIQEDPFEEGPRMALNFGHTVGHALEAASGFRLRHGEAVAIGMVVETRLAERLGLAESGLTEEIVTVLRGLGLPTRVPVDLDQAAIYRAMQRDKKRTPERLRFSLPTRVGEVCIRIVENEWKRIEHALRDGS